MEESTFLKAKELTERMAGLEIVKQMIVSVIKQNDLQAQVSLQIVGIGIQLPFMRDLTANLFSPYFSEDDVIIVEKAFDEMIEKTKKEFEAL